MPDHTCPHLSPIGGWCRLKANFKCPASVGRVGCPFPKLPDLNRRASERLEEILYANRAKGFEELTQPFQSAQIQWRVASLSRDGRRALLKPEVSLRTIIDRLDNAVGAGGWSESYQNLPSGHVSCRLTILGIHKEALSEKAEDLQEARSEALRTAAAKFGVARGLERINGVWVDWDEENERPLETPVLPAWAVADTPKLETRLLSVTAPSVAISEHRAQEKLIQEIIRAVRELPGGEGALRRIMKRHNKAEDKRSLYAELRRTYRELSNSALKAA
jgi:hypothetical protein